MTKIYQLRNNNYHIQKYRELISQGQREDILTEINQALRQQFPQEISYNNFGDVKYTITRILRQALQMQSKVDGSEDIINDIIRKLSESLQVAAFPTITPKVIEIIADIFGVKPPNGGGKPPTDNGGNGLERSLLYNIFKALAFVVVVLIFLAGLALIIVYITNAVLPTRSEPQIVATPLATPHAEMNAWRDLISKSNAPFLYNGQALPGRLSSDGRYQQYWMPVDIFSSTYMTLTMETNATVPLVVGLYELRDDFTPGQGSIGAVYEGRETFHTIYTYRLDMQGDSPKRYGLLVGTVGSPPNDVVVEYSVKMEQLGICYANIVITDPVNNGVPVRSFAGALDKLNDEHYPMGRDVRVGIVGATILQDELWYEILYPTAPHGRGWVSGEHFNIDPAAPACNTVILEAQNDD